MPTSERFKELRRRLAELRRHMLPQEFSPTGDYSARELDRARGYRLLAHAEIEAFIEAVTWTAAVKRVGEWKRVKNPSDLVICLLAHYHSAWDLNDEEYESEFPDNARPRVKNSISETVDAAMNQYNRIQSTNHGVRERNLKRLVMPIGVRIEDLDPTWVTNLDAFGGRRGEVAHKSVRVTQLIDPREEYRVVKELLVGLQELDRMVQAIAG